MNFSRDSSSDEEEEVVAAPIAQPISSRAARWYAPDSDDEAEAVSAQRVVLSAGERQMKEIEDTMNTLEFLTDEGHWQSGVKKLVELINLTDKFMNVGSVDARSSPPQVIAFADQLMNAANDILQSGGESLSPVEVRACREVARRLKDFQARITPATTTVEATEKPTPVQHVSDAESFVRKVMACDTPQKLMRLLQSSVVAELPRHLYVYAYATLATLILSTGNELVSLPTATFAKALECATFCFQALLAEKIIVDSTSRNVDGLPFNPLATPRRTYIPGGLEGLIHSLYLQWRRSLQDHSIHTDRRYSAIQNEWNLVGFADRVLDWAISRNAKGVIGSTAFVLLRLVAPMHASHFAEMQANVQSQRVQLGQLRMCDELKDLISSVTEDVRREAVLLHAYATAQLGDFRVAKEACQRDPCFSDLSSLSVYQKVLLNRCAVAIALGAFKAGALRETVDGLKDLLARDRRTDYAWTVLIGQGRIANRLMENADVTEQDRQRAEIFFFDCHVPVHHVIDTKLVMKAFLLSCILTLYRQETEPTSDRLRDDAFLPTFYFEYLRQVRRNIFPQPLQTVEELCLAFRLAIHRGDGREAQNLLKALDVTYPPIIEATTDAALRNYAEQLGSNFTCVSVSFLAEQFGIDVDVMRRMLAKLICEGSLVGQLDDGDDVVYCEPPTSEVQRLINATARALFATEATERTGGRTRGRGRGLRQPRTSFS